MNKKFLIGIDPGVNTGWAEYCAETKQLRELHTLKIHEAIMLLEAINVQYEPGEWIVIFEDARKRKWFSSKGREALQGAGSIKRDCTILEDYLKSRGIDYEARAPQRGATKWTAEQFKRLTGWQGRTSEHARDAALLVFGG